MCQIFDFFELQKYISLILFSEKGFTLFVMPMKIMWGTGAPLRLVATPRVSFVPNCDSRN